MDTLKIDIALLDLATCRVLLQAALQRCSALESQLEAANNERLLKPVAPASLPGGQSSDIDLLSGYEAIAAFLGLTARQAKHRALSGVIPVFKQGRVPCATKSGLRAHLAQQMSRSEDGR